MPTQDQTKPQPAGLGVALQRAFMKLHVSLYQRTGGAIGGKLAGRPMLLLTTIGRKSQQKRLTPILYVPDNGRFILIASNGGAPKHPIWWLNLQANPHASIQVRRKTIAVIATQADAEERKRLWLLITAKYKNFQDYQDRTIREIPVVILTPED